MIHLWSFSIDPFFFFAPFRALGMNYGVLVIALDWTVM